jgi:hypothetical protein
VHLISHLSSSLWTLALELECAHEIFSLSPYLGWLDHFSVFDSQTGFLSFPKDFLNYLDGQVSGSQTEY